MKKKIIIEIKTVSGYEYYNEMTELTYKCPTDRSFLIITRVGSLKLDVIKTEELTSKKICRIQKRNLKNNLEELEKEFESRFDVSCSETEENINSTEWNSDREEELLQEQIEAAKKKAKELEEKLKIAK